MKDVDYEKISKKLFGNIPKEELPPVDQVLKALEIAKGTKFRISPGLLERYAKERAASRKGATEEKGCGRCDYDWESCAVCDVPGDKCTECDALDCYPGISGDYS